ncbi:MAG: thermosome subunit alpha [Candidatus Hodarchaeota archaeon]
MAQLGGTPIILLKEGSERTRGKDAQRNNMAAAQVIGEAVRSSLGPKGMDKMLVDSFGDVVITNDGATILKEIDVQHPVAKFIIELAKTQDDEVGDGTTTVVILAGELLKKAEELLDEDIHPTIIVEGYRKATDEAMKYMDELAIPVTKDDDETLKKIAMTAMGSKNVSTSADFLSDLVVKAVKAIVRDDGSVDIDDIKVEKKEGQDLDATTLVDGIALDKEVVHPGMPKKIENAKIALVAAQLEIKKTEFDAELTVSDPTQMKAFLDREAEMIKEMVQKVANSGANVLLCQKGIDDIAQHFLAKKGILAVRRIKKSDMEKLARATDAKIASNLDDLSADDLGSAGLVEERKIGDDDMVFVEKCPAAKSVTLLVRGGTELVVAEAERSIHDAICVVRNVVTDGKVVHGGGAPETAVARKLRDFAASLPDREQLAVQAYSDALEVIPRTLAENAGLDPIDIFVELRKKHNEGLQSAGVDPIEGIVRDMAGTNVIEPALVKKQAISAAAEAAQMILRIDDVIASKGAGGPGGPGGPEGPGGDEDMDF